MDGRCQVMPSLQISWPKTRLVPKARLHKKGLPGVLAKWTWQPIEVMPQYEKDVGKNHMIYSAQKDRIDMYYDFSIKK